MKKIFSLVLLSLSLSALTATHHGRIEETEYAGERCDVSVKKLGRGKLQLQVFTLGESFKMIIREDTAQMNINTKSLHLPKSDITGSGLFDEGRPVSLKINVTQHLADQKFHDSINCTF